jgi:rhodanese-related sulfurtransferase
MSALDLQRINVSFFTPAPVDLDIGPLLAIFNRWRIEPSPFQWIDLADYGHMSDGVRAWLIGKRGELAFDISLDGRSALLYRNKGELEGSLSDRFKTAIARALELLRVLTAETEFPAELNPHLGRLVLRVNDRVQAPNTDATHQLLGAVMTEILDELYGAGSYRTEANDGLYGIAVEAEGQHTIEGLLARLGGPASAELPAVPRRISPEEAHRLVSDEGWIYLDVRTVQEFEAGHPEGAYNIPVTNPDFRAVVDASIPGDAKIVLGCKTGGRSSRALGILEGAGRTELTDQRAGWEGSPDGEPGWSRVGLPSSKQAAPGRDYASLRATG